MLKRFACICLVVSTMGFATGSAVAQGAKGGGKAPAESAVDIELDDPGSEPTGPVVAGQMTEEAAQAKRLFDSEKWAQAALALDRVFKNETNDDEGNRQIAQYNLAIALYQLKLHQASYNIFSLIADNPNHLKFNETLLWLSKLATQLPEPADIIERVGKYKADAIARFDNPNQHELFWQLNYLLGRYKYRNRQYEEAIRLFQNVSKRSKYFVQAQFFMGISYVQLRRSVPAVKSFNRIVRAIDDGVEGVEDEQRMRDLAFLSMARTYYTASIRLDDNNTPTVDATKLSAAVKYWNKIDVASEYWLDGLFEQSWAYFMAGDYPRALGNIHTIQSPFFPNSFYPESDILKAVIYFANCQYKEATTVVARFKLKYEPIKAEMEKILARYKGENQEAKMFDFLRNVREGKADLDAKVRPIVENSLSDRQLLRNLEYVRVLEEEERVFKKAPAAFKNSPLGGDVQDALDFAKDLAIRNAGDLARARFQRTVDELNEHLRDSAKILIDVTAAERNKLEQAVQSGQVSREESKIYGVVKPDEEHVLWPFNGEFWRDELGFYRQVVISNCGR
ncbi:MAG TPA: tetratricopeptide repeat protein [Polyangiaceae bacterium]|jgi:tetratricopeptide (TPR) repeat protein|nr:MAG: Tetratricopeptide repeat protein [Deltaproteobacteria bacterium ADurb.Bin207]HNS97877.1 tetratricopeptide repeat protein [Polyangiaceae bacterium]HNZ22538.1 tetratricopeptide repeat protein [Polyangiaceae bacterium]HOD25295.1 tetratricopeptide repeat protein [Polyangiaceae bacterium]HOE48544.1 tetratricopeptide repeat protein [Polyangiaceae bacterium]